MWGPMQWFGKEANQFNIGEALVLPGTGRAGPTARRPADPDRGHQTLRTRYVDRAGQPQQQVAAAGAYDIVVVDDHGDPARVVRNSSPR